MYQTLQMKETPDLLFQRRKQAGEDLPGATIELVGGSGPRSGIQFLVFSLLLEGELPSSHPFLPLIPPTFGHEAGISQPWLRAISVLGTDLQALCIWDLHKMPGVVYHHQLLLQMRKTKAFRG